MPSPPPPALPPAPESLTAAQFARRERIVRAAGELLLKSEYGKIQMRDVAEHAGVALGTLYRYFKSKEQLFAAVQLDWMDSLQQNIRSHPPESDTNQGRLGDLLHRNVRVFQVLPQVFQVFMILEVAKDPIAKEAWEVSSRMTHATFMEALSGIDNPTAEALVHVALGVLMSELRRWVLGRQSIDDVNQNLDMALRLLFTYKDPAQPDQT